MKLQLPTISAIWTWGTKSQENLNKIIKLDDFDFTYKYNNSILEIDKPISKIYDTLIRFGDKRVLK